MKPVRNGRLSALLFTAILCVFAACSGQDREMMVGGNEDEADRILIAGSSTVAPFVTTAAEYFGASTPFSTPVVETTGTGGGFKLFCQGNDGTTSSIATASRPITAGETELCRKNGVENIVELQLGKDGIVFINALSGPEMALSDRDIFLALAKRVPGENGLIDNPYQYWSELNPELPDIRIEVYGPPPTSGTRDALVSLALEAGALTFPDLRALKMTDKDAFYALAHTVRTDGRWLDSGENDTQIIQALIRNPLAMGVVGFSFLNQSGDRVKPARIDGELPTFETISSGDYALSRSLFLYVKPEHLESRPAVKAFLTEVFSDDAMTDTGYLIEKGLIPPKSQDRRLTMAELMD